MRFSELLLALLIRRTTGLSFQSLSAFANNSACCGDYIWRVAVCEAAWRAAESRRRWERRCAAFSDRGSALAFSSPHSVQVQQTILKVTTQDIGNSMELCNFLTSVKTPRTHRATHRGVFFCFKWQKKPKSPDCDFLPPRFCAFVLWTPEDKVQSHMHLERKRFS